MAKVQITGDGGQEAIVTNLGELLVTSSTVPPLTEQKSRPFRQYFTDDGTASGSNDMGVDGSVTEQVFYIRSDEFDDRYITNINIIVGYGASGSPFRWCDGTALTNGTQLIYSSARGEVEMHDGIKSNQDLFRLSHDPIRTDWEVRGVNALNDYGYFINVDLENYMPPYGIKLGRGTGQRLEFRIRDNAGAAADSFNAIAYGFDRFE